jgi:hypothetical protein
LSIRIAGFPEIVQSITNALEDAFLGQLAWIQSEEYAGNTMIAIEGYEMPSMPLELRREIAA